MFCGFGPGLWLQSLCTLRVFGVLLDGRQGLVCVCVHAVSAATSVWSVGGNRYAGGPLL